MYQISEKNENVGYYVPKEGGVRGSDTMTIFSGAQHPIAAHLSINHMLDAEVSAANTNYIGYMGPNEAAKEFIAPAILADRASTRTRRSSTSSTSCRPRTGRRTSTSTAGRRCVAVDSAASGPGGRGERRPAAGRRAARARRAVAGLARILLVPGVAWLVAVLRRPARLISWSASGTRTSWTGSSSSNPEPRQLRAGDRPGFLPTFLNSLRYAAVTTILSLAHRLPGRLLDLPLRRAPQGAAPDPRDAAVLDQHLIRTYAWMIILRDNGILNSILQAVGLIDEPIILLKTDFSVILGMTYGFLPFAILPLFVRSTGWTRPSCRRPATCTPVAGRRSST